MSARRPRGALRADSASCRGHPVQRHEAANIVGEVLQADFGARPHDADRAHDPADLCPKFHPLMSRVLASFEP